MAELSEILKDLDAEKAEAIQQAISENYVGRNVAHEDKQIVGKIVGKTLGSFETKLKRSLKGIDENLIKPAEVDELGFEKAFDTAFERLQHSFSDLKQKASASGGSDKEIKAQLDEISSKYTKAVSDLNAISSQKSNIEKENESIRNEFSSYKTNLALNQKKNEALKTVEFTDSLQGKARELAIKGFLDDVHSKYKIELDSDEQTGMRITDSTGQRVSKDNKFLTLGEIYLDEAKSSGLLKVSGGNVNSKKTIIFGNRKPELNSDTNEQVLKIKSR